MDAHDVNALLEERKAELNTVDVYAGHTFDDGVHTKAVYELIADSLEKWSRVCLSWENLTANAAEQIDQVLDDCAANQDLKWEDWPSWQFNENHQAKYDLSTAIGTALLDALANAYPYDWVICVRVCGDDQHQDVDEFALWARNYQAFTYRPRAFETAKGGTCYMDVFALALDMRDAAPPMDAKRRVAPSPILLLPGYSTDMQKQQALAKLVSTLRDEPFVASAGYTTVVPVWRSTMPLNNFSDGGIVEAVYGTVNATASTRHWNPVR